MLFGLSQLLQAQKALALLSSKPVASPFLILELYSFGLNRSYLAYSVHIFIHEHIIVQALGLERKQYAYRVFLPNMIHLYNLWRISYIIE